MLMLPLLLMQGDSSMLTSITSEVATSTVDQASSTVPPPSLSSASPSTVELSLKTPETEVLDQTEMYSLENSLDNSHLLQVRASPLGSIFTCNDN